MITWENYEEYMMMHTDGELLPAEEQALMAFVKQHPELKKEMAAYERTRLTPDATQVFANKNTLLKPLPEKRVIAFPQWGKYSIAAGIAALICISLFKYMDTDKNNNQVAKINTTEQQTINPVKNNIQNIVKTDKQTAVAINDTPAKTQIMPVIAPKVARVSKKVRKKGIAKNTKPGTDLCFSAHVLTPYTVSKLQIAETKQLPNDKDKAETLTAIDIPAYTVQPIEQEHKKTLWDILPLDDVKKKRLENIAVMASEAYQQVNNVKQTIEDQSINIAIEKKKLVISF